MTSCARYPDDDLPLRYVSGDLPDPAQAAFEDHLFECDACLARVERYQAGQRLPAAGKPPVGAVADIRTHENGRAAAPRVRWWPRVAAAAAVLLALTALFLLRRADAPATRGPDVPAAAAAQPAATLQLAVLAMVAPPRLLGIDGGGAESDTRFTDGMAAYARSDWAAAARALRQVETPEARFYLAITDLMRGDTSAAVTSLDAVRRSGRRPWAAESLFYLGKAALQSGDVGTAREWFAAARDAGAGPDSEAARLLAALDEIAAN